MDKNKRFEFRLTDQELTDLRKLAKRRGTSAGDLLRSYIRRAAQKLRK